MTQQHGETPIIVKNKIIPVHDPVFTLLSPGLACPLLLRCPLHLPLRSSLLIFYLILKAHHGMASLLKTTPFLWPDETSPSSPGLSWKPSEIIITLLA